MFVAGNMIGYALKMRLIILTTLILFSVPLYAEKVYKTVDEEGHIIFTDKPTENSEEIKLQELKTIKNPNPAKYKPLQNKVPDPDSGSVYKVLLVTNPAEGSGLRSNDGNISISLSLQPSLRSGHKLVITLDGEEISSGNALSVSLQNVDRGTHTIEAKVIDNNGKQLITTSSSFSLLRAHQ